jgi:hypothetical protein
MIPFRYFTYAVIVVSTFTVDLKADTKQKTDQQVDSSASNAGPQKSDIDAQIVQLKARREICVGRLKYAQSEGNRFLTRDWLTYRRYMIEVQRYSDEIADIDAQLAELQKQQQAAVKS